MRQETEIPRTMTLDEYFTFNQAADVKHEFYDGTVVSMAGSTVVHSLITSNVISGINIRLKKGPCRIFSSDLRVKIPNYPTYVYPDATVICGPVEKDPQDKTGESILNPTLVIEVLSPSTGMRDFTIKTAQYLSVSTLREVILVSQDIAQVTLISKSDDSGWRFSPVKGLDSIVKLQSLGIEIPLAEIFDGVELSSNPFETKL